MRRVVTGHKNGKSVILDNTELQAKFMPQGEGRAVWSTDKVSNIPLEEEYIEYIKKQISQTAIKIPESGEITLGISTLIPDEELFKNAKEKGIDLIENWRKYLGDDYGMHTTDTIDYDIILSGEIWMEVDGGVEVHLKAGDCVVQNGTRHAWRNKSTQNCVMATVMIGANRKKGAKQV